MIGGERLLALGVLGAALAGLGISAYLSAVHASQAPLVCSARGPVDCERVLTSAYAQILGTAIPTSAAGILWFGVSGVLALFEVGLSRARAALQRRSRARPAHAALYPRQAGASAQRTAGAALHAAAAMREPLRRRVLLWYYALLSCALVILGTWAVVLYRNGESARHGTVVLIASSQTASALSTPSVRVRGPRGWADVSGAVTRQVPAAPANVQLAQAALPSGTYDAMQVSGHYLGVKFDVSAGRVTPVLLVVSGGQPAVAYGGGETVSLALNELAGHLRSLSEFHLVDQNGNVFDNRAIAGRTLILAAFHTTCTTTCPLYTGLFLDLQRRAPRDVMLVEASTDPVHDTPEALRSYAAKVGANWRFVTGTAEQLQTFWQPLDVQLSGDQLHSSTMAIVDGKGFIRSVYRGVPDVGGALPAPLLDGLSPLGHQELVSRGDGWGAAQVLGSLRDVNSIMQHEASGQGGVPDFAATDLDGHPVSLAQFRGRPLLINFWASWCVPCRTELPLLQRAADRSPRLAVVLVDERDDAAAARRFLRELDVRLPVASDPDASIGARYRVAGLPVTFFVRADGSIAGSRLGQLDESTLDEHLRAIGAA